MPRVRGDGTPQLTLLTVMTKFLFLGMPLVEVIRATTVAPAEAIGRGGTLGTLTPGTAADVAILEHRAAGRSTSWTSTATAARATGRSARFVRSSQAAS